MCVGFIYFTYCYYHLQWNFSKTMIFFLCFSWQENNYNIRITHIVKSCSAPRNHIKVMICGNWLEEKKAKKLSQWSEFWKNKNRMPMPNQILDPTFTWKNDDWWIYTFLIDSYCISDVMFGICLTKNEMKMIIYWVE